VWELPRIARPPLERGGAPFGRAPRLGAGARRKAACKATSKRKYLVRNQLTTRSRTVRVKPRKVNQREGDPPAL